MHQVPVVVYHEAVVVLRVLPEICSCAFQVGRSDTGLVSRCARSQEVQTCQVDIVHSCSRYRASKVAAVAMSCMMWQRPDEGNSRCPDRRVDKVSSDKPLPSLYGSPRTPCLAEHHVACRDVHHTV